MHVQPHYYRVLRWSLVTNLGEAMRSSCGFKLLALCLNNNNNYYIVRLAFNVCIAVVKNFTLNLFQGSCWLEVETFFNHYS